MVLVVGKHHALNGINDVIQVPDVFIGIQSWADLTIDGDRGKKAHFETKKRLLKKRSKRSSFIQCSPPCWSFLTVNIQMTVFS